VSGSARPAPRRNERAATHDEIARYAYHLFEERGREPGRALDDWLAAERALAPEPPRAPDGGEEPGVGESLADVVEAAREKEARLVTG
jgi:hypothetical protein